MNFQNENRNLIVETESSAPAFAYVLLGLVLVCIFVYRLGTADEVKKTAPVVKQIEKVSATEGVPTAK